MTITKSLVEPNPTNFCWRGLRLIAACSCFMMTILLSPLLLLFYAAFAIRARITACYLARRGMTLVGAPDSMAGQERKAVIHVLCTVSSYSTVSSLQKIALERLVLRTKEDGTLMFPNLSRYVTRRAGYLVWKEEQHFRIEEHVKCWPTERRPRTEDELAHYMSEAVNSPLPARKSNWQLLVLDCDFPAEKATSTAKGAVTCHGTCTVVLVRFHHAIADGVNLLRLMLEHLSDPDTRAIPAPLKPPAGRPQSCLSTSMVRLARSVAAFLYAPYVQIRQMAEADNNALHGPKLTGRRLVHWSKPIPLASIKNIKNLTATTVNDVMMTCVAGGLRRYLLGRGLPVPDCVHSVIPFSKNDLHKPLNLKNSLSFVVAALATGQKDSLARLRVTKARMDELKEAADVLVNRGFVRLVYNVLPVGVTDLGGKMTPMSMVVSNVPGPSAPSNYCGCQMTRCIPVVPIMGTIGMTVCILSYCEEMIISVCVDTAVIDSHKGLKELMRGFYDELHELQTSIHV